jgi:hypothetical protein
MVVHSFVQYICNGTVLSTTHLAKTTQRQRCPWCRQSVER